LYGAELGPFGKYIRNIWKVLKCGAGEGWRRSAGPKYTELRRRGLSYRKEGRKEGRKANCVGHIL